ncbi:beta-N-acetylhexosaminidase [Callorhinchus milii]|uniref:beta-N-acetylhexosaminidase n=1 Tax=Callorhinchus milii TaxID=7868 RepID=A0A4W3H2R6_CALMI|nr:beta-N-acetylhexosaminidase [Callorhinchus milii]XP_042196940.1 beta-N-acetylhexosaminidase [Callorhinchus milii]|eukprot:gi/632952196/ref/XP_007891721.1/ PREDICTED: hexosaminidase D-like [Callorhinchus milii]
MVRRPYLQVLRLLVLLIALLVGASLLYPSESKPVDDPSHIDFWKKAKDPRAKATLESREITGEARHRTTTEQTINKENRRQPKQYGAAGMKIVHLDLKGAAPKLLYLEQIFSLLHTLGVHGVLMEYEDMFPFEGDLEVLKSTYAYSSADIEKIQDLADRNQLEIIPLVQTFGHMEFVLKHDKYLTLREVENYPNSLNPHLPDSLKLVKEMISQVLDKHPACSRIHIGADEVYYLGEGVETKQWLSEHEEDRGKLFLDHVMAVSSYLTTKYPGIEVIMWDDMMRKISKETIQQTGIAQYVAPMVWFYAAQFSTDSVEEILSKYLESGFRNVWFASAFKGASGAAQDRTPINLHLQNQLQWLKVIKSLPKFPSLHFQGLALTGWQRYDHYSALCELLPVAIPSLVICAQTVRYGSFSTEAKTTSLQTLGFKDIDLEKNVSEGTGSFAGAEIYEMVCHIHDNLKSEITNVLQDNSDIKGWFTNYHRKYHFANPRNLERFGNKVLKVHQKWEEYLAKLRLQMENIYFPDTVEEWMEENVNLYMDALRVFVEDYKKIVQLQAKPKHK